MPSRRRNATWKPFHEGSQALNEECRSETTSSLGLLAPVRNIADIVDAFASVSFINGSYPAISSNDLLRAVEVISIYGTYTLDHFIVFRTASHNFPLNDHASGTFYCPEGSNYKVLVVSSKMGAVAFRHVCERSSVSSLDDIEANAAKVAGSLIRENVDGHSAFFKEAVASRFKLFTRARLGVRMDDVDCPTTPAHPMTTCYPTRTPSPFVKPNFKNIDDLLGAFATHAVHRKGGEEYSVEPFECPHPSLRQPLVFCHSLSSRVS